MGHIIGWALLQSFPNLHFPFIQKEHILLSLFFSCSLFFSFSFSLDSVCSSPTISISSIIISSCGSLRVGSGWIIACGSLRVGSGWIIACGSLTVNVFISLMSFSLCSLCSLLLCSLCSLPSPPLLYS